MSKNMQADLDKNLSKVSKSKTFSQNLWNSAINDAQRQIMEAETRVKELRKAIGVFTALRERGEVFRVE